MGFVVIAGHGSFSYAMHKYFCSSGQKPFFVEKDAEVSACPEGRASEQVDDLAPGQTDAPAK